MRLASPFRFIALALLCAFPAAAGAEDAAASLNVEEARGVAALMDADAGVVKAGRSCPANLHGTRNSAVARLVGSAPSSVALCSKSPNRCYQLCAAGGGRQCFSLALAFQANAEAVKPRHAQTLFTLACAAGEAAGCTNRAAGLRNDYYSDDPLRRWSAKAKAACEFRSFSIACDNDDAWGCAMLGQAYQEGEGVRRNVALARDAYAKSCGIAEEFAACGFAKARRGQMPQQGSGKKR